MRCLVTGGVGFIGSNLVKSLLRDHEVLIIDNLSTGNLANLHNGAKYVEYKDILDLMNLQIDAIFHLGIPSSSPMYRRNRNLVGLAINNFQSILELARMKDCKVVYASSSSVYNGQTIPMHEDMKIIPTDFYTEARYSMERLSKLYYDLYGTESIGLRLFSVYGKPEIYKGQYANVVSQFYWSIRSNTRPIIYGDGTQTRDFIHVSDVVRAFELAMFSGIQNDIFNVGTGKSYSFNSIIDMINTVLGTDIEPIYKPNPIKNYVQHTCADMTKIQIALDFKYTIDLEKGIQLILDSDRERS